MLKVKTFKLSGVKRLDTVEGKPPWGGFHLGLHLPWGGFHLGLNLVEMRYKDSGKVL